ncbi:MAG: hypothetical protein HFE83_09335 [Lachnospiraceae bacterium]|nr:hypothetical protein [Lachnospiraceae bacterium]
MGDIDTMNRELKKRQLRNKIISLPRADEPGEGEKKPARRGWRLFFPALALFLAACGFYFYRYQSESSFTDYEVTWEKSMRFVDTAEGEKEEGVQGKDVSEGSFVGFAYYGENMLKYTKNGATYIDASGKDIWTQGYEIKTPIICVNGDYAAIADQQGSQIYIFNKEGCTGVAKTQLPITKVAVSAKGVTAAVVEDSTSSYIFYYKKDGDTLGIDIKMLLSGDGYPLDIALSPDGKQIVMSVAYLENGIMKNKIAFYDFSEIGKNVENRFIGAFEDEFAGGIAARVTYLNEDTVAVFSNTGIGFISVKNVIPDTNVITVPIEEMIESICYSDKYAGIVTDSGFGGAKRMDLYTTDGKKAGSFEFDFAYSGIKIDGERVLLYNEESCIMYGVNGRKRFEGQFDFAVSCVRGGKKGRNSLIVAGGEKMQEIKLK